MYIKRYAILVFALCALQSLGQAVLPDSIKQRFAGVPMDSNYVIQLNARATFYLKTNPAVSREIASYTAELSHQMKFTQGYARALTITGNSYWYEGIYEFAQDYYLLAARQYESIDDSLGLGQVYNNIGEVNKRLGEYKKALQYLLQSMQLKKNDSTQGLTLYNIGELYLNLQQYDEARKYIDASLKIARKRNDERVIAADYWTIARINARQGFFDESLIYFAKAEALWIRVGETRSLIQTYQDLAEIYRRKGALDKASGYLDKASALTAGIHVPDLQISTYLGYSRIDSARGNYQRALYYLSRHNTLKDSVYNLVKAEQITRVQTIYETELHERENQQLRIEKELKDQQLKAREVLLAAISIGLFIVGILAWMLFRQRGQILKVNKKLQEKNEEVHDQKEAIEIQAAVLSEFNEELKELNKTLENRIEKRSQQLLLQNKRLAEYTFINAHNLRAPVASILGLINLIHQVDHEERETILAHLKTCSEQLDHIIREINRNLEAAIINDRIQDND